MPQCKRTVIPTPALMAWGEGGWLVPGRVELTLPAVVGSGMATWMAETWAATTAGRSSLACRCRSDDELYWQLAKPGGGSADRSVAAVGAGYAIEADPGGVRGTAGGEAALRQAWTTLLQLVGRGEAVQGRDALVVPSVRIEDRPALPVRSLHLCVFPETRREQLETVVALAGMLRFSHICVEFWGTLQRRSLPQLAWPGAWSREEAARLFDLIRSFGMEPIPAFNIWGHAAQARSIYGRHAVLDQDPSLGRLFEPDGWAWCLSSGEVRDLIGEVVEETCAIAGPGGFFHIGCDEAHSHASCDECRRHDRIDLLADHIGAVTVRLRSAGRRPIMWGDALLDRQAWPEPVTALSTPWNGTHQVLDRLDRSIVIADWQYSVAVGEFPTVPYFLGKGFDVLASPWFDPANIQAAARTARTRGALGIMATTWDRLQGNMAILPFAAQSSWSGDMEGSSGNFAFLMGHLALLLRKARSSARDYARAGWSDREV